MKRFNNNKDKYPKLRRGQLVTSFGIGSIVVLQNNSSVMICDAIKNWARDNNKEEIEDVRLAKHLKVNGFLKFPEKYITARRFPEMLRCPGYKCGIINKLEWWRQEWYKKHKNSPAKLKEFDLKPKCKNHYFQALLPFGFVVACRKGHIDDLPINEWLHESKNDSGNSCPAKCITYSETSSTGARGIWIKCDSCKKVKNMESAYGQIHSLTCSGRRPWVLGEKQTSQRGCKEKAHLLQRAGANVYYPDIKSSIYIPSSYVVEDAALEDDRNSNRNTFSEEEYRYQEFQALTILPTNRESDFVIKRKSGDQYQKIPMLNQVVIVERLREARIQTGFSRITPAIMYYEDGKPIPEHKRIETVRLNDYRARLLPGDQVYGEGLFLEFNFDNLQDGLKKLADENKIENLLNRNSPYFEHLKAFGNPSARLLFLHSLSHALIRQMSLDCGYPSSSLRERIYCSSENSPNNMAGIMIYATGHGSDCTLGGVVKQGLPKLLDKTFYNSLHQAERCSSDPLCRDAESQGYLGLNLAACHACLMLPETSCELFNAYLDRGVILEVCDQGVVV